MHKGEWEDTDDDKGRQIGSGRMRKITGHRHICRFGANNNDEGTPPDTHVYVTTNGKQTDTQAGKHTNIPVWNNGHKQRQ